MRRVVDIQVARTVQIYRKDLFSSFVLPESTAALLERLSAPLQVARDGNPVEPL